MTVAIAFATESADVPFSTIIYIDLSFQSVLFAVEIALWARYVNKKIVRSLEEIPATMDEYEPVVILFAPARSFRDFLFNKVTEPQRLQE